MSRIDTITCAICLLGLVIFLNNAKADHDMLTVKIQNGDEIIELNWRRKEQYLANKHLPVWSAEKGKVPQLIPNVMTEVDEFVVYQDVEKTSAVMYLKSHNKIYGVIDTRFFIIALPFDQVGPDMYHTVGGEFIKVRTDNADVDHSPRNYDALLSTLLTNEEIQYVNSVLDNADAVHRHWPSQPGYYEYNIIPSTSAVHQPVDGHQHIGQNFDVTHQALLLDDNNPGILTENTRNNIMPPANLNSHSRSTTRQKKTPNNNQHSPQNIDGTHRVFSRCVPSSPSKYSRSRVFSNNIMNNVGHRNNSDFDVIRVPLGNIKVDHNQRNSRMYSGMDQSLTKTLYAEILVFITNDVFNKNVNLNLLDNVAALVQQYILYFNAIDMLFAKLAKDGIFIHINIAGIVLEAEPGTFPHSYKEGTSDQIDTLASIVNFPEYIKRYREIFTEDLFDFFFLSTSHALYNENDAAVGVARVPFEIYENRKKHKPYVDLLGAIVQQSEGVGTYVSASHEIAHLMSVQHDPPKGELDCNGIDASNPECIAIMQEVEGFCQNCVTWSKKSVEEFKVYASTNRNRCFLLNYPRSLHPYDHPMPLLTHHDQCICYGFDSFTMDSLHINNIPVDFCNDRLKCETRKIVKTPLPIDGTPCGPAKVCWRKRCLGTGQLAHYYKDNKIKENQPPISRKRKKNHVRVESNRV